MKQGGLASRIENKRQVPAQVEGRNPKPPHGHEETRAVLQGWETVSRVPKHYLAEGMSIMTGGQ